MTEVIEIALENLESGAHQTRTGMDERSLTELASDIKERGLLQPIIVRPLGEIHEVICGHRRLAAHSLNGAPTIPCIVRDMDDLEATLTAISENAQREDLTPWDEARSYQKLLDLGNSQRRVAKLLNISQTKISQALTMGDMPWNVEQAVISQLISPTHAQEMLRIRKWMKEFGYWEDEDLRLILMGHFLLEIEDHILMKIPMSMADLRRLIDDWIICQVDQLLFPPESIARRSTSVGHDYDEKLRIAERLQELYKDRIEERQVHWMGYALKLRARRGDFDYDWCYWCNNRVLGTTLDDNGLCPHCQTDPEAFGQASSD